MAINDNAVFTAAKGYVLLAAEGTAAPTPADVAAFDPEVGITSLAADGIATVEWDSVGHTAEDELPEFGFDGGDSEVKGTWQNPALKEVITDPAVDFMTFSLHQFDEAALELYYGVTNSSATVGQYDVDDAPTTTTKRALLVILVDGDINVAFHATKAGIKREGAIELDREELTTLPLRATFLKMTGKKLFSWISLGTGVNPA